MTWGRRTAALALSPQPPVSCSSSNSNDGQNRLAADNDKVTRGD
jgi:hypothetical protein